MQKHCALTALLIPIFLFLLIFQNNLNSKDSQGMKVRSINSWDYAQIDANNISAWITNYGSLFRHPLTGNSGLEWPKGGGVYAIYASGLWIGAKVNNDIRVAVSEYSYEFGPGSIDPITHLPNDPNDPHYIVYKINQGETIPQQAIDDGCPSEVWGDQMLWSVYNDADPAYHVNFQTAPLGVEIQQTVFGWGSAGAPIGNLVFLRWLIINKSGQTLDSTYLSVWSDPDLGDSGDDYVGCDTTLSLGYCYNSNNNDAEYGPAPPAVGYDYLQGPIVPSPGDSARFMGMWIYDFKNLPMTSFVYYENTNQINGNPQTGPEVYNYMQSLWRDGSHMTYGGDGTNPNNPLTNFMFTGDPETGTGWLETSPKDKRFLMTTGPFTMMPGDSQEVVVGVLISRGLSNLNSVTLLKQEDTFLQAQFDNFFLDVPQDIITDVSYPNANQAQIDIQVNIQTANQVTAELFNHAGTFISSLTLFDDGMHNDESPNDGIWGNNIILDRGGTALFMNLIVNYPNIGDRTWEKVATNITIAGQFIINNPIIGADNINGDGLANPGEYIRYTLEVANQTPFFLPDVEIEQLETFETNYVQDLKAPHGNKIFPIMNMFQTTSWNYDPDSVYFQFYLSPSTPPNDSVHIKFKISNSSHNVWYDTVAFFVHQIPNTPQYGTMDLVNGFTTGRLGYMLIDPTFLTGHTYRVYLHEYQNNLLYDIEDYTTGSTLLTNQNFPDIYGFNSPIVEGFKVLQGTATNIAYAYDWEWTPEDQRWLTGGGFSGSIFFNSVDLGKDFFGSTLKEWQYKNVSIYFDSSLATNCKVYRRDLGYAVQPGLGTFYGEAYDISDTTNPRRLNIVFIEDDNQKPADMIWNPDSSFNGAREYLFIMNSDYDPVTAGGYDDINWGPGADVIFGCWPAIRSGHTFMENPAEFKLFINPELVHDSTVYEFTPIWLSISNKDRFPRVFALKQNYPNPFNPTTNIQFSIAKNVKVKLEIFNVLGQRIKTLINGKLSPDEYEIKWDGRNESGKLLGSGIYFYRLKAGDYIETRKMIFLK